VCSTAFLVPFVKEGLGLVRANLRPNAALGRAHSKRVAGHHDEEQAGKWGRKIAES